TNYPYALILFTPHPPKRGDGNISHKQKKTKNHNPGLPSFLFLTALLNTTTRIIAIQYVTLFSSVGIADQRLTTSIRNPQSELRNSILWWSCRGCLHLFPFRTE